MALMMGAQRGQSRTTERNVDVHGYAMLYSDIVNDLGGVLCHSGGVCRSCLGIKAQSS